MKITKNKVLVGLVLLTLAAAVVLGLRSVGMGAPVEEAEPAEWTAPEQLATPLPTESLPGPGRCWEHWGC